MLLFLCFPGRAQASDLPEAGDTSALQRMAADGAEDWRLRIRAIRLLARSGEAGAVDALLAAAGEFCPALRWNATLALGSFPGSYRVVNALIELLDDRALLVREAAVQSLGRVGDPRAVPFLAELLASASFTLRLHAVRALGAIGDSSALDALRSAARSEADPSLREEALRLVQERSGGGGAVSSAPPGISHRSGKRP